MKTYKEFLAEQKNNLQESVNTLKEGYVPDHQDHPFHSLMTGFGYKHVSTGHESNSTTNNVSATDHVYKHPDHDSTVALHTNQKKLENGTHASPYHSSSLGHSFQLTAAALVKKHKNDSK